MKHRMLALVLAVLLAAGTLGAVSAKAAGSATAYLADLCRTEGQQSGTLYVLDQSEKLDNGNTVRFLLQYDTSAKEVTAAVATTGMGYDGCLAAILIPDGGKAPFGESMLQDSKFLAAAQLKADYCPGDPVAFEAYNGASAKRAAFEDYNADCCETLVGFLHTLLSKGGFTLKDLGMDTAAKWYASHTAPSTPSPKPTQTPASPKPTTTPSTPKPETPRTIRNPFRDVREGEFFFTPVLWAVSHDPLITDGTSETTFSPDDTCTRGQVVTFLWRSMGCAEPTKTNNPFRDVTASDYFYKAVLWAVEKGITDGTDAEHFSPEQGCTRGQVVTFLARAANGAPSGTKNPFADVTAADYFYKPVLWAVEKKITDGLTETAFGPEATCTRGQIVTFLWRAAGSPAPGTN